MSVSGRPIIRVVSGPSPTKAGIGTAMTIGLAPVVSAMSTAADLMPFDGQELFGVLHFRLHSAREAEKRSNWFGGRFYNRLSGQSAEYIPLSGVHLQQTFSAAGILPPDFIMPRGKYEMRLDYAQKAYDTLKQRLGL